MDLYDFDKIEVAPGKELSQEQVDEINKSVVVEEPTCLEEYSVTRATRVDAELRARQIEEIQGLDERIAELQTKLEGPYFEGEDCGYNPFDRLMCCDSNRVDDKSTTIEELVTGDLEELLEEKRKLHKTLREQLDETVRDYEECRQSWGEWLANCRSGTKYHAGRCFTSGKNRVDPGNVSESNELDVVDQEPGVAGMTPDVASSYSGRL